ncbi:MULTISPECIES: fructosamine kinase family protein [Halomonas]|uniref:Fructosamine kinase n=1 Tax=Halomonas halophila TaxID=29573 RepID=A0ABQ0U525_9GAMM|nr:MULTISPECIES: fructosamine kinase family protein [Halomonas]MDR5890770.1 fructosamine kinase family protein [Halomonas salina]WJY08389.1 fructosamine kinase family protein [Halomonas halophila]GEK73535.1 fructosamine kinase [Halomonas halophila]
MVDDALTALLERLDLGFRGPLEPLSGGDIAAVYRLDTDRGEAVVKRDDPARLAGEAEGLRALGAATGRLVVPEVWGEGDGWLVMEALTPARRTDTGERALAEGLRELHGVGHSPHGWARDNACGATPQPNAPLDDGRAFQRERRLLPLMRACHARGLLDDRLCARLEAVAYGLEGWLPDTPARLVHGDLWSGNVLYTTRGPAMIDPAVYRHYPEVDLAMLTLFGAPSQAFFDAYWNGAAPADWSRREALFQLYPLLNHLLLFGGAYRSGVARALQRVEAGG